MLGHALSMKAIHGINTKKDKSLQESRGPVASGRFGGGGIKLLFLDYRFFIPSHTGRHRGLLNFCFAGWVSAPGFKEGIPLFGTLILQASNLSALKGIVTV